METNVCWWTHVRAVVRVRAQLLSLLFAIVLPLAAPVPAASQSAVPTPWQVIDIGGAATPGGISYREGTFTVSGTGSDIWGTADQFRFVHVPVSGDVDIVARVVRVEHIDDWTKAGVMVRASLAPDAAHASMLALPTYGVAVEHRAAQGADTYYYTFQPVFAPAWVKLERRGPIVIAYWSLDGVDWWWTGEVSLDLPRTFYVGLALASHAATTASATFDNVRVTGPVGEGHVNDPPLVASVDGQGAATAPPPANVALPENTSSSSPPLPAGWRSGDIGSHPAPGATQYSHGSFTMSSTSSDIWGTADQFRFTYQAVSGDVDLVARVAWVEYVDDWTKAGVMVRASLAAEAAQTSMLAIPSFGVALEHRPATNAETHYRAAEAGVFAPAWLKLERRGARIAAYWSWDGAAWVPAGETTMNLPPTFYMGLALTSHSTRNATAIFDNVQIRQAPAEAPVALNQPPSVTLTAPTAAASFTAPATITLDAVATDVDGQISRVEFYADGMLVAIATSAPHRATWSNVQPGTYRLTAVAYDDAGEMTTSAEIAVVVSATAVSETMLLLFTPSPDHETNVTGYLLEVFDAGTGRSLGERRLTQYLGVPAIIDGECRVDVSAVLSALPQGEYVATVTAIGPAGQSRSEVSPIFVR